MHGHAHDSVDYRVGRCRLVANPAGCVRNTMVAMGGTRFELENKRFDAGLVLEVKGSKPVQGG